MDKEKIIKLAGRYKWATLAATAIMLVLIAPYVMAAIQGLVGIAVLAVLGGTMVALTPWTARKLANLQLSLLKGEARANPIETRQTLALQARERIRQAETEWRTLATEVRNFGDMVSGLRTTQPEDAASFEDQLRDLTRLVEVRKNAISEARKRADEFDAATERAARKWQVALAAQRMQKLSGAQKDDALNKLLAQESLDSVQAAMNRALVDLDVALAAEVPPMLSAPSASTPVPMFDAAAAWPFETGQKVERS